ncbi:MAG: hypothetical protein MZU95_14400 [Desulfomicrobium escambiense]|nr:hypothetical protein [Desulfomicrobium escambiense]
MIGVGVTNLHQPRRQLNLFEAYDSQRKTPTAPDPKVQEVLDQLRQRFGEEVIIPASHIEKIQGKPMTETSSMQEGNAQIEPSVNNWKWLDVILVTAGTGLLLWPVACWFAGVAAGRSCGHSAIQGKSWPDQRSTGNYQLIGKPVLFRFVAEQETLVGVGFHAFVLHMGNDRSADRIIRDPVGSAGHPVDPPYLGSTQ